MAQHGYLGDGYGAHGEFDPDRGDDRERGEDRDRSWRGRDRDGDRGFMFGDRPEGGRGYSSHPDDHYRSWRDRHMEALDRDYQEYCREREQQFHQDFDSWRSQRHGNPQPLRTGMTQTGLSHDPSGELELSGDSAVDQQGTTDPMGAATLGTNSSGRKGR